MSPDPEIRFRALFDLRLELAGIVTLDGILTEANTRALALIGATRASVVGRLFWETPWWTHEPALQRRLEEAVRAGARGESSRFEATHRAVDGTLHSVDFSLTPVLDADGTTAFLLAESIDITDQRRDRKRAVESDDRLAAIVESAMDAIITIDQHQRIVVFNTAAELMFGVSRADALDSDLSRFVPERFREAHERNIRLYQTTGSTSRRMGALGRVFGLRNDGSEFPIEAALSQSNSAGDRLMTVILRDVSEQYAAREKLRRSEERTRVAENLASVGTLAAGLAHEIGTPMSVVRGHAELLETKVSDEKSRWRVATIIEQIDRISNILRALLNLTRPQRPQRVPIRVQELREVIQTALSFLEERFRKRGIEVARELGSREQDAAALPSLVGDPEKLQQLFLNLFLNASDAMDERGGTLTVALEAEGSESLLVTIRDTGEGIAADELARIFEPFYTTKEAGRGSGLGLVVARSIATDHGATLDVSSTPGSGTEFQLRIPLLSDAEAAEQSSSPA